MKLIFFRGIIGIIFILLIDNVSYSQHRADNWVFNEFGLKFQSDSVIIRKDFAPHQYRAAGVISDSKGELLFYSDGFDVWNKNHSIMPNGRNLYFSSEYPATHESLVVPKPGSETLYYLFTVEPDNGQATTGLYYSIIDMSLQNGLGDVILKDKKVLSGVSNRITAVLHQNNQDVWLIVQKSNSRRYYSYLITPSGLSQTAVLSEGSQVLLYSYGQMKASPDGRKVVSTYDGFDLFDFNNATGELLNVKNFTSPISYRGFYGTEFSPDATKLFAHVQGSTGEGSLYQYDLSGQSFDQINNSRTLLITEDYNSLSQMQLAPNGKIYITKGGGGGGTEHLGVIDNPNEYGKNCKVTENGLYLEGSATFIDNTPNFIQNYFFKTSFGVNDACLGSSVDFYITNESFLDSVRWYFGEGSSSTALHPKFKYSKAGEYAVRLIAHYPERIDTIKKIVTINPSPEFDLGEDKMVCYGQELSVAEGFASYVWNTGENNRSILIKKAGNYKVTVSNAFGCLFTDSVFLNVADLPIINMADTVRIGTLDSIQVNPGNFKSYKWSTGKTSASIYLKTEGWYSVTVENENGCTVTKSFYVTKETENNENTKGWKLLNPLPSTLAGVDLCFINTQVGFIINNNQILGTTDGGNKWNIISSIISGKRIAFKENNGYVIGDGGAIYKSTYMGGGWNKLNVGFSDNLNAISLISKDTVMITSDSKLFISVDGGQSWKTSSMDGLIIKDCYFINSRVGHLACANGKILKTTDGGNSWYNTSPLNSSTYDVKRIYFVDNRTGFALTGSNDVLKTTDGGENWKSVIHMNSSINSSCFLDNQIGFITCDYGLIFKTTDGGSTWNKIGSQNGEMGGSTIKRIYFIDSMIGFAVGMNGWIIKTIDGGKSWIQYSPTYNDIKQLKFITDKIGYGLVGNTFFKTTDGGTNWINIGSPAPLGNVVQFDFINSNMGFCIAGGSAGSSMQVAKVYKTMDGGKTWTVTNKDADILNESLYCIDFIDPFVGYVSGGYNLSSTFKTIDGGNTWQQINTISFGQMQFINSQVGYARNINNWYNRIYKTVDGGKTWKITFEITEHINSFHFLNEKTGYFVGGNSANYKTTDGGVTWQKLSLQYLNYNGVRFFNDNIGYASEEYGKIYQTSNGGMSWDLLDKPYFISKVELYGKGLFVFGQNGIIIKNTVSYQPAVFIINAASDITNNIATLSGNVTSNEGTVRDIKFEYGEYALFNTVSVIPDSVQYNGTSNCSVVLKVLKANTTYFYRLSATCNGIKYSSNVMEFKTLPDYQLIMNNVYEVSAHEADLSGTIILNKEGLANIKFEYGINNNYSFSVDASPNSIAGGNTSTVTAHLNGLKPQTSYIVRIKATYHDSIVYSAANYFNTSYDYIINVFNPMVSGNNASIDSYISTYKDTLRNIELEYGTTREYRQHVVTTPNQVNKYYSQIINSTLTNLNQDSVYYYRIKADMGDETVYSNEYVFRVSGGVILVPLEMQKLSDSSVILRGLINPAGIYLYNIQFEYGLTDNMGESANCIPRYSNSTRAENIESAVNNLLPETTYYFRIKAIDWNKKEYYSEVFTYYTGPTSAEKIENKDRNLVYPNPAHDNVTVKSVDPVQKIEFIDINGTVLTSKTNEGSLDISIYPNGLYFIKVYTTKGTAISKILKN